jgi:hypothetical protein
MFCVTKLGKASYVNESKTLSTHSTETGTSVLTLLRVHASAKTSTSTLNATTTEEVLELRDRVAETLNVVYTTLKL